MPRIAAESIDEHVRRQTQRITAAARAAFAERGYMRTELGYIAQKVGLARNSLYRYFPNKQHLLLACIEAEMAPYLDRLQTLADDYPQAHERIEAWVEAQFALATGPAHVSMEFIGEVAAQGEALQQRVAELHAAPAAVLQQALLELPSRRDSAALYAAMLNAMVLAATREALALPAAEQPQVLQELLAAVRCLL